LVIYTKFICDIERPPSDIIFLTVQDDKEDKQHQQIEQAVVKTPKHHLKIMLADFSSEHIEYIVKITIANKGVRETSNDDLGVVTCSTYKNRDYL
jgi:hypothetical protein